ncbi:MAG: hypothetical protein LBM00_08170 [Deltaproteobacteria bacterium]|nr:hypothetical protein [Deltaproteobacteria bacterium]
MKNYKLIGGIAGGLLLAVILYAVFGGGISASEVIKRAEQDLALVQPWMDIKVDKIGADTSNNAITYTGVTYSIKELPGLVIKVDSMVESGVDDNTYKGEPGDITKIASLVCTGISIHYEGQQVATIAQYTYEQLALRYRDMLKFFSENKPDAINEHPDLMFKKMLPLYKDYSVGRIYAKDTKIDFMFITGSIKEVEARDMTLTKYGPGSMTDFQLSAMGRKVFGLDKLSYASGSLPAFITDIIADPDKILSDKNFAKKFENDPLAALSPLEIKNFVMDNLMIDAGSGPVSVKQLTSDFSMVNGNVNFTFAIADLLLSRAFIEATPDLEPLAEVIPNDLHLNGTLGVLLNSQNEPVDLTTRADFKENNLGGFTLDLAMDMSKDTLYSRNHLRRSERQQPRVKNAEFSIEDTGLIDFLLACKAVVDYDDVETLKAGMLEELMEEKASPRNSGRLQQATMDAAINLLEHGGTFKLALKPQQPVNVDELENVRSDEDLTKLGYSVSYTPR